MVVTISVKVLILEAFKVILFAQDRSSKSLQFHLRVFSRMMTTQFGDEIQGLIDACFGRLK